MCISETQASDSISLQIASDCLRMVSGSHANRSTNNTTIETVLKPNTEATSAFLRVRWGSKEILDGKSVLAGCGHCTPAKARMKMTKLHLNTKYFNKVFYLNGVRG